MGFITFPLEYSGPELPTGVLDSPLVDAPLERLTPPSKDIEEPHDLKMPPADVNQPGKDPDEPAQGVPIGAVVDDPLISLEKCASGQELLEQGPGFFSENGELLSPGIDRAQRNVQ